MFSQVIDLLVRKRQQRTRVLLLALRLLFTLVLTSMLATRLGHDVERWVWADPQLAMARLFDGSYVMAFALYILVWKLSFGLVHYFLTLYGIFLSGSIYRLLARAIQKEPRLVGKAWYEPAMVVIAWMFNMVDIVVIEPSGVRPGSQFYRFCDYLKAVDSGKRGTSEYQASLVISLTIQFLVIYSLVGIQVLLPWYLKMAAILVLGSLIMSNLISFALDTLISLKHRRLLELLTRMDSRVTTQNGTSMQEVDKHLPLGEG
ncbi:MAG: hypothetical protein KIT10_09645 [Flavobacteriales bacterium]|nr:hypothetical protein [Flavobacteriales bacterium]